MQVKEDLKSKAQDLLIWLNDNLPSPGRIKLMFGRGRSIVVFFADSTSESLEECSKRNTPDSIKEKIEQLKGMSQDDLERYNLEKKYEDEPPILIVFQVLAQITSLLEKYFHDPNTLKRIRDVVIKTSIDIDSKEE